MFTCVKCGERLHKGIDREYLENKLEFTNINFDNVCDSCLEDLDDAIDEVIEAWDIYEK